MFANTWNMVLDWFWDRSERRKLVRGFNEASREAFVQGTVPTLMKAKMSRGESSYKHQFSDWLNSGFRIVAFSGRQLSKSELVKIGEVILSDSVLVRKLIVLGFDTLEVCGDEGMYGCHWQIKVPALLGEGL